MLLATVKTYNHEDDNYEYRGRCVSEWLEIRTSLITKIQILRKTSNVSYVTNLVQFSAPISEATCLDLTFRHVNVIFVLATYVTIVSGRSLE